MIVALARIDGQPCVVIGQDRTTQTRIKPMGPAALREARRGMRLANELGLPLVSFIDTPGAELSPEAEQGAIAGEIARCISSMSTMRVPTVSVLLGQGCGGGALALLPADASIAAENAWLSPLPPEGASAIVHGDVDHAAEMAEAAADQRPRPVRVRHRAPPRARAGRRHPRGVRPGDGRRGRPSSCALRARMTLLDLAAVAPEVDGVAPFNEATPFALRDGSPLATGSGTTTVVGARTRSATPPSRSSSTRDHRRQGRGRACGRPARRGETRFWAHGDLPGAQALAAAAGLQAGAHAARPAARRRGSPEPSARPTA